MQSVGLYRDSTLLLPTGTSKSIGVESSKSGRKVCFYKIIDVVDHGHKGLNNRP